MVQSLTVASRFESGRRPPLGIAPSGIASFLVLPARPDLVLDVFDVVELACADRPQEETPRREGHEERDEEEMK
jgi:hypothetical protein